MNTKMKNTTPYANCSSESLSYKLADIQYMKKIINNIAGDELSYNNATTLTNLLNELENCIENLMENRKNQNTEN